MYGTIVGGIFKDMFAHSGKVHALVSINCATRLPSFICGRPGVICINLGVSLG
jgi:hypothetical protein